MEQDDEDAGPQDYGLAWWYGLAPEIEQPTAGDFDGDGDVDAADLARWEGDFGLNGDSDDDGDGDSDLADLLAWQRGFGAGSPVSASSLVPEPSSALLMLGFSSFALVRHRRGNAGGCSVI